MNSGGAQGRAPNAQDAQFRKYQPVVGRRMSNDFRRAVKFQSPKRGLGFFGRELPERLDGRLKHFFLWYFLFFALEKKKVHLRIKIFFKRKVALKFQ